MLVTLSILRNFISWKIIRIVFNRLKRAIFVRRNTKFVRKSEVEAKILRIDLDSRFFEKSFPFEENFSRRFLYFFRFDEPESGIAETRGKEPPLRGEDSHGVAEKKSSSHSSREKIDRSGENRENRRATNDDSTNVNGVSIRGEKPGNSVLLACK